jgi:hypothetical protein
VTGVVAYVALVFVLPALALGHHMEDFPPLLWWRWVRAARGRGGCCAPAGALQGAFRLPGDLRAAPEPAETLSGRPGPSWARADTDDRTDIEEAAA